MRWAYFLSVVIGAMWSKYPYSVFYKCESISGRIFIMVEDTKSKICFTSGSEYVISKVTGDITIFRVNRSELKRCEGKLVEKASDLMLMVNP